MKALARKLFSIIQALLGNSDRTRGLTLVAPQLSASELAEIRVRASFFFPGAQGEHIRVVSALSPHVLLDASPILTFGLAAKPAGKMASLHQGIFDIDWRTNPGDGWNWIEAATWAARHKPDIAGSKQAFAKLKNRLAATGLGKCYLFGTGPSLGRAIERDWSDGVRVVCNTIVRDAALWQHIAPHLLVAGDGIYHFGFTDFAKAFRRDLRVRLAASPNVPFMYPAQFDIIIRRELAGLESQLIPISMGPATSLHTSIGSGFELPNLGNVLNLLLLPVGCALSKHVGLWGFDGRAPADVLFWSNSPKQSYTELLGTLQLAHPAFFDSHVPKHDPEKYLRSVHGDVLEHALQAAEQAGWHFEMLHPTWTATLARRLAPGVAKVPVAT